jgi:putative ABC transport system permease protein
VLARLGGDLGAGFFDGAQLAVEAAPSALAAFVCLGVVVAVAGSWLPARRVAAVAASGGDRAGWQRCSAQSFSRRSLADWRVRLRR